VLNDDQSIDFSLGVAAVATVRIEHEFETTALDPGACHDQAEPRMVEQLGERIFPHCSPPSTRRPRNLLGDARGNMNTHRKVEAAPAVFNLD